MSSRKVTGPTLPPRSSRKQASRWLASRQDCGSGAGIRRASERGGGSRLGTDSALLAREEAANIAFMFQENEDGHDQNEQQAGLPEGDIEEHDGHRGRQRRQRGIARGGGYRRPDQAEDDGSWEVEAEQHADEG